MGDMADMFLDQVIDQEDNIQSFLAGQMDFDEAMGCGVLDEQGCLSDAKTGHLSDDFKSGFYSNN